MSRTYRKRQDKFYYTREEYENDEWWQKWKNYESYDRLVAKYYSDNERGMWQIPKHWKKDFRIRPFRSAERMCLRKEMQTVERGNIIYPIKKQFDNYYW